MRQSIKAGLGYVLIIFAIGFVLGTLRVLVLIPYFGEISAVLLEIPFMLLFSWIVAGWLIRTLRVPKKIGARVLMGGSAFLVLMIAELAVSLFAFDRTMAAHFMHYLTLGGILGLTGQLIFAMIPSLHLLRGR